MLLVSLQVFHQSLAAVIVYTLDENIRNDVLVVEQQASESHLQLLIVFCCFLFII